jgi:hypothetical protein
LKFCAKRIINSTQRPLSLAVSQAVEKCHFL